MKWNEMNRTHAMTGVMNSVVMNSFVMNSVVITSLKSFQVFN